MQGVIEKNFDLYLELVNIDKSTLDAQALQSVRTIFYQVFSMALIALLEITSNTNEAEGKQIFASLFVEIEKELLKNKSIPREDIN
jgi:hypothetical protein